MSSISVQIAQIFEIDLKPHHNDPHLLTVIHNFLLSILHTSQNVSHHFAVF